jgi:hypothetical protein
MSRKNPSQTLTLARVDKIVDLILKGERYLTKKEKPLWPTPKEAWEVGLATWSDCNMYLEDRRDLNFSGTQRSRRSYKISEGLDKLRHQHRVDDGFVWKIKHGWSSVWGFVCASTEPAARQIGHTMFALVSEDRLKVTPDRLTAEKVSLGGWDVAAKHNLEMISTFRQNIRDNQSRITELKKRMDGDQANIDSLMAAVMLGGDLGGSGAEAEAG